MKRVIMMKDWIVGREGGREGGRVKLSFQCLRPFGPQTKKINCCNKHSFSIAALQMSVA
jgi:hypothetical protein